MSALHRIQWVDERIRRGEYPNVTRMIERFEISRRQALRDIEYMKDSLGAPIAYCPKNKGYFYSDDAYAVTSLWMTEQEELMLSELAAHYQVIADRDHHRSETFLALAELLGRLSRNRVMKLAYKPWDGIVPFRATMVRESARPVASGIPTSMQPYFGGLDEQQREVFEFFDSHDIIPSILASGVNYKIIHPNWLRNKLVQYIDKMRSTNMI